MTANNKENSLFISCSGIFKRKSAESFTKIKLGMVRKNIAGKQINPNVGSIFVTRSEGLVKIVIDAPNPIKKPKALDVPIAIFEGICFLIKQGKNKVAPPIPINPEIMEKQKPIKLVVNFDGKIDVFILGSWL